jgi:hypothetical protein
MHQTVLGAADIKDVVAADTHDASLSGIVFTAATAAADMATATAILAMATATTAATILAVVAAAISATIATAILAVVAAASIAAASIAAAGIAATVITATILVGTGPGVRCSQEKSKCHESSSERCLFEIHLNTLFLLGSRPG